MKRSLLLLMILACVQDLFSQYIEKKWFNRKDSVYGYYTVVPPSSGRVQGALVLLDGYGGNADGFFAETRIHNVAWNNDLLVIAIPTGTRLYLDQSMTDLLNRILSETAKNYGLRKDQFAIGGMSSGGTIAVRYAQRCIEKPADYPIQPKAVFDVDSPLDLAGLYKSSETELKKKNGGWWLGEAQMIIDKLKSDFGDPAVSLMKYENASPFTRESKDSSNEKQLLRVAFRTYHDVDVNWHLQNRSRSIYQTNMLDGSELVSRLLTMGNKQAEFIQSEITGRRSNGQRHPHSWNIVDEAELVQWIKEKLNFYPDHIAKQYHYEAPAGWETELIMFPMDFAPGITYKGFEDLRFAPGWDQEKSPERWGYTLLWWLDGQYTFSEKILSRDLENYFTGLTKRRAVADSVDMKVFIPAKVTVEKQATISGDIETYSAKLSLFDAQVTHKPGNLFIKIHVKACAEKSRTIILLEASAYPFDQPVWEKLDNINSQFQCTK